MQSHEEVTQFEELVAIWRDLNIPAETILRAGVEAGVLGDDSFEACVHIDQNECGHYNTYRRYNECVGSACPTFDVDGWYIVADNAEYERLS